MISEQLCLSCGLCCNGVIFRDVKLGKGDDAKALKKAGLPISGRGPGKFPQPCAALNGCYCRVYAIRPMYCRQFECGLFKGVVGGRISMARALRVVRATLRKVAKVERLLRSLGDGENELSLSTRFHRTTQLMGRVPIEGNAADSYGRLTLEMHELNLLLSENFYPGKSEFGPKK